MNELVNEITKFMDEHVKDNCKHKSGSFQFHVYINSKRQPDGSLKPDTLDIDDDIYIWYLRFPGYTCGNIRIRKSDNTIESIVLTRRGGGFSGGDETVFNDPDKLEKTLTEKYKGKNISEVPYEED